MLNGRIPRPDHLHRDDKWPQQWARSWTPLDYRSLCLWITCCIKAEPKPYNQNQKRIVDNLPKTRLEGNCYITTDPEWVRTKGAEGAKIGRGLCSVCWRFWKFDRRVTTICPVCKVHLYVDCCFLQWHREHSDFGVTYSDSNNFWQSSNLAVQNGFISRGSSGLPQLFPVAVQGFAWIFESLF
jgi:hypothetical protein